MGKTMIYSALYYPGSLANGDLIVRDNRYYVGKYSETFPVWFQYLRKNYPNEHVVLFADTASPIPIQGILDKYLHEPYDVSNPECSRMINTDSDSPLVHVRWLSEHTGKYFWAMQRNLVEGLCSAYYSGHDFFWLDNDAFLNTDILSLVRKSNADVAAPQIAHHQMTMDSVCTFISSSRLHALDEICSLPDYLLNVLSNGPTDLRMHSLQEGGLYKTFCYGKTLQLANLIELSHLSCYDNFMDFIKRNPLDTPEYRYLIDQLEKIDWSKMPGVERKFHDMNFRALI